jgi:hypothetical protein
MGGVDWGGSVKRGGVGMMHWEKKEKVGKDIY